MFSGGSALSSNVNRAHHYQNNHRQDHGDADKVSRGPFCPARMRVVELDKQKPGDYMIFCYMTQELISAAPRTA